MTEQGIPREPLDIQTNRHGSWVGIHKKGGIYVQESSYSFLAFTAVMFLAAAIFLLCSWHFKFRLDLISKWVIAGGLAWGGVCTFLFGYVFRNLIGQKVEIDPEKKTVRILRGASSIPVMPGVRFDEERLDIWLRWSDVAGLQICFQPKDRSLNSESTDGYQLNLVWRGKDGSFQRHCLEKNASRKTIDKLAAKYTLICGFKIVD